jgi:hypothetical protein
MRSQTFPGAVLLPDSIAGTRTLSADTVYRIAGLVKVGPGSLLSIPPGTLIVADPAPARSCLLVERGGKIVARGEGTCPIIFTSARAQGMRAPGDWCGIIILGSATINAAGGAATLPGIPDARYGGGDDADSSGALSFVRIEYAGLPLAGETGRDALTLAGVGNRTVIENVQASYGGEDGFAWSGGSANGRNLISFGSTSADFRSGLGYHGRLQFLFAMRDSSRSDAAISNGFESENDAAASANAPLTAPVISNMTLVGPMAHDSDAAGRFRSGVLLRGNSRYGLFNSVITGWLEGIRADGAGIGAAMTGCPQPADLRLRNTLVGGQTVVWGTGGTSLVNLAFWFVCFAGNQNPGNYPLLGIRAVTQADLHAPDPRPTAASPAATGSDFTDALLAPGNNLAFTATDYKGAFDPDLTRRAQWDSSWTNYRPASTSYVKHRAGWNLVGLANLPASSEKDSVYHSAISTAFGYGAGGYTIVDTLQSGAGYFLKLGDNCTIEQIGDPVTLPRTIPVSAGWNLISSGSGESAPVAGIVASGTTVISRYFGFDGQYFGAASIEPGRAYWVQCSTAGTLTLNPAQ